MNGKIYQQTVKTTNTNHDRFEVLKLFTRKLVNCRYKISAKKVAEYLNKGKFGYTFDETGDNLITNDSVFADDVALAVDRIRAIYSEPHISLKKEEIAALHQGSYITLKQRAGDPSLIIRAGKVIATGEICIAYDNFAIRVIEVK